jgi:hypothetical protein
VYKSRCTLGGSLSPLHGVSSVHGWRDGLQLWRVAGNTLNKQPPTNDKGCSSSFWVGRGANNSSLRINILRKRHTPESIWKKSGDVD